MKKISKVLIIFIIPILTFLAIYTKSSNISASALSNISSEIVIDVNSLRVLHQRNINKKMYMASTTKILTAITIIENFDVNKEITVTKDSIGVEGSSIYLEEGEKLTIKHLLYGLMLRSGNDCAQTLAYHCGGDNFIDLMNKTAVKIGAVNSNFVNPHGLHDDNHYTTAYDLALISAYSMKNQTFREIVSTKSIDIPFTTRNSKRRLINKNKMLSNFEGTTGIKTGYTKKAGRCLVSSCKRNGLELICVVLNCYNMWERSKELLTNCFNEYKSYSILKKDNIVDFYTNSNNEKCGIIVEKDIILPLTKHEYENIKIEIEYFNNLIKPIKKHSNIGIIKIFVENNLLFTEKAYNIIGIK